jgi:hypothetical protein
MTQDTALKNAGADSPASAIGGPLLLALGAAVYAISFALPAVGISSYGNDSLKGWECARFALLAFAGPSNDSWNFSVPLFASGLINPLTVAYLVLRMLGKRPRTRRALAIVALSFIPLSWYVIAHDLRIEVGHVAWVAGLLMMMAPEAVMSRILRSRHDPHGQDHPQVHQL